MDSLAVILLSLLPAVVIAAGLKDLTTMTIPNWMSLALVGGFLPAALAVGLEPAQIGWHIAAGFAALVLGMALFALNWVGGGDAKIMAAACLWLGVDGSALFLLWTAIAGGLFSLMLLAARAHAGPVLAGGPQWLGRLMAPKGDIPYGVAIAAGALLAFPASAMMRAFSGA